MQVSETVEITGHLMDSGVLAKVLDDVLDYGGDYAIERFNVGKTHEDESHARVVVFADIAPGGYVIAVGRLHPSGQLVDTVAGATLVIDPATLNEATTGDWRN